jgi:hypothetical protein
MEVFRKSPRARNPGYFGESFQVNEQLLSTYPPEMHALLCLSELT